MSNSVLEGKFSPEGIPRLICRSQDNQLVINLILESDADKVIGALILRKLFCVIG